MITLSRVDTVRKALQRSWDTLFANSTDSEMRSLRIPGAGKYNSNDQPIVLVVSSMAGVRALRWRSTSAAPSRSCRVSTRA